MSNAAIAYQNRADSGTIVASGALTSAPASYLQNHHVGRKWQVTGTSANLTIDLGTSYSIDTYMLAGLNLTAGGTTRVRASLTDATATGSLLYDSGSIVGAVDPNYGYLISLDDAPVTVRYVRIDLTDATLSFIAAGRLFIGLRSAFTYNFAIGQASGRIDPSVKTKSRGGQTHVDNNHGAIYRVWDFNFAMMTVTDVQGFIESIGLLNGARVDVLMMKDPASSNLGRDSIWGLLSELPPAVVVDGFISGAPVYSKAFKIEERL